MRAADLAPASPPTSQSARTVADDPAAALAASMRRTTPAGSRHAHAWDASDGASTAHRSVLLVFGGQSGGHSAIGNYFALEIEEVAAVMRGLTCILS